MCLCLCVCVIMNINKRYTLFLMLLWWIQFDSFYALFLNLNLKTLESFYKIQYIEQNKISDRTPKTDFIVLWLITHV